MAFWLDIAAFALKALVLVIGVAAAAFLIARAARGGGGGGDDSDEIEIERLDAGWRAREARLNAAMAPKKERKARLKAAKKAAKAPPPPARIFVLDFKGDMQASAVNRLGREIDAVLSVARADADEVVLRLESPGGTVTGYGLAAARLQRLRAARLKLTVCVDQVAASGGYMMAAVADRLVAAPFAMIGSIGVVAQVPNLNRILKKNDIDVEVMTAGEFKRSVSLLGEITPEGRRAFSRQARRDARRLQEPDRGAEAECRHRRGRQRRCLAGARRFGAWTCRRDLRQRRLSVPRPRPRGDLSDQELRAKAADPAMVGPFRLRGAAAVSKRCLRRLPRNSPFRFCERREATQRRSCSCLNISRSNKPTPAGAGVGAGAVAAWFSTR